MNALRVAALVAAFLISVGGAAAQAFADACRRRCGRLILCATTPGVVMVPSTPGVLWKMATPRRYMNADYARAISGDIYGGDFRKNPALATELFRHVKYKSRLGYYLQLLAASGWTSIHRLPGLRQDAVVHALVVGGASGDAGERAARHHDQLAARRRTGRRPSAAPTRSRGNWPAGACRPWVRPSRCRENRTSSPPSGCAVVTTRPYPTVA